MQNQKFSHGTLSFCSSKPAQPTQTNKRWTKGKKGKRVQKCLFYIMEGGSCLRKVQFLCISIVLAQILLIFCCVVLKIFSNHSRFVFKAMSPITAPIINPLAYPITTGFQPNSNEDSDSWSSSKLEGDGDVSHFFDKRLPHEFPSYGLLLSALNCFPCGVEPLRSLW